VCNIAHSESISKLCEKFDHHCATLMRAHNLVYSYWFRDIRWFSLDILSHLKDIAIDTESLLWNIKDTQFSLSGMIDFAELADMLLE
jgi:hypothetical protein